MTPIDSRTELRIDAIEAFELRLPALGELTIAGGRAVGRRDGAPRVLVRVEADGIVGWGESTPTPGWCYETNESIVSTQVRYLGPAVLGLPAWDLDGATRAMERAIHPGLTTGAPIAKSAIDTALHDLTGRALGIGLGQLWGHRRLDAIPLTWVVSDAEPDACADQVDAGHDAGYSAFKVKLGLGTAREDVARVAAVRERAPRAFVSVDANAGFNLETARAVARRLADLDIAWFEQPLPANDLRGMKALAADRVLPLALDETLVHPRDLLTFADTVDVAVMKVQRCGGLSGSRRVGLLAEELGLTVGGSGLTDSAIGFAASLHLLAAHGSTAPADLNGPQFLRSDYLMSPWSPVHEGLAAVPTGPGLGVDVDEDAVRAMSLTHHRVT